MFKKKEYNGKEYVNLELNDMNIGDKVTFYINEERKSGSNTYGEWALFSCRNDEVGHFSVFVNNNMKTKDYNKNLLQVFREKIGKKITIEKKAGETKSGRVFKYYDVGGNSSPSSNNIQLTKKEEPKKIILRNTKDGWSEEAILKGLKAGGKYDDWDYFIGTLMRYGCEEDRAKELWKNRHSIQL